MLWVFDRYEVWLVSTYPDWVNLKLVLKKPHRAPKANYWLAWNGKRFAKNHDEEVLRKRQPEVYAAVLRFANGANFPYRAELA